MNYEPETDDAILEGLLYRADAASPGADDPDDDELLALFAEGRLQGEDRELFLRHLDTHPQMRPLVQAYAKCNEAEALAKVPTPCKPEVAHSRATSAARSWFAAGMERAKRFTAKLPNLAWPRGGPSRQAPSGAGTITLPWVYPRAAFAMAAATILVALTAFVWLIGQPAGGPLVASLNRVNFKELGGETGMFEKDAESGLPRHIEAMLSDVAEKDERAALMRGYDLLQSAAVDRTKAAAAATEFEKLTRQYPQSFFAWLGLSNARLLDEDFAGAKEATEHALKLKPNSIDAQFNLASTLTQLARQQKTPSSTGAALSAWRDVTSHGDRLPAEYREWADEEIKMLQPK